MCVSYLKVGTGPLQVSDLALNFSESLVLIMELFQLLLLLMDFFLIQLFPSSVHVRPNQREKTKQRS